MYLGKFSDDKPSTDGNELNQNTAFLTRFISTKFDKCLNGSIMYVLLVLSFILLIYLSISGMCSSAAHVFNIGKYGLRGLNLLSANITFT